ncbi:MAG: hypothetical protein RIE73_06900 [Coleofasciculus sp. C1-SOL-03]|jgi:hypothetical protein|uniref:hypothetical protein n=1 Tax=Coleofasciculus sp. C1-SOL-03 TaxID=3069522 RepID=UPI0032F49EA0
MAQTDKEKEFVELPALLKNKFRIDSTQLWNSIIILYCEGERDALERFFHLFEKYLNRSYNTEDQINDDMSLETAIASLEP